MPRLRELIPDAEGLLALAPADLAGYLLEVLLTVDPSEHGLWHRRNFCLQAGADFSADLRTQGHNREVMQACAEAWAWLETTRMICPHPEQDHDWFVPTRRGREIKDHHHLKRLVDDEALPSRFLHPALHGDTRPLFLQGRHDLAVFSAFHTLEVAIRDAAGLGIESIGTRLASRAFNPEDGPLTDPAAELGERHALMNLMCGALGSYKNPQSHRRVGLDAAEAREMILLSSHLLGIVDSRRVPQQIPSSRSSD